MRIPNWAVLGAALFYCGPAVHAVEPVAVAPAPVLVASPDSELAACQAFLDKRAQAGDDRVNYYLFFTNYAIPLKWTWKNEEVELRRQAELALPYVLNSLAGVHADTFIVKPKRLPGSDTIWYVDIEDFGWSKEDVNAVARLSPYFLNPVVDATNTTILLRSDWFLVYATDNTKLNDRGIKTIPYYVLQYGLGKEPANKDDFLKTWEIDEKRAQARNILTGTIVDAGDSGVSSHTRQLGRARTDLGYYWFTKDVKSHDLDPDAVQSRDYLEELKASRVDAGEYIATNKRRLQTYFLTAGTAGNFKRVEDGDTGIVVDRQDAHDVRVRTAKSCIVCHSFGIIPYTNAFRELLAKGGKLYAKDKVRERELRSFYLTYKNGEEVKQDNDLFAAAVADCNGLSPEDNLKAYLSVYEWYWTQKVGLEQAAAEFGVMPAELKVGIQGATTARLVQLHQGRGVPREIWDSPNYGGYVQVGLFLKRLDSSRLAPPTGAQEAPLRQGSEEGTVPLLPEKSVGVVQTLLVDKDDKPVVYLNKGTTVTVLKDYDEDWCKVRVGQHQGYVRRAHLR
jgi:hypothetical protein